MDLTPFVDSLRHDLLVAAEVAGPDAKVAAERLVAALDSSARLALMDALSAAADEITAEMAPGSVDVRLRGREPHFVVTAPAPPEPPLPPPPPEPPAIEGDDGITARISLRLPDSLKSKIEESANTIGVSVNTWLVRALTDALTSAAGSARRSSGQAAERRGNSISGWAR